MSNIAAEYPMTSGRLSLAAFTLAVAAVATWLLANTFEALWFPAAALGIVAVVLGRKARGRARAAGSKGTLALVAMIVGGLLAAQVVAWTVIWGIGQLV
jgi:hypothetical protein